MKTRLVGMEEVRTRLRHRLTLANPDPRKDDAEEIHTVVTQRGKPTAVLVGIEWYRRAREAIGEPTDL